jgi:chromosome segregation ATPase
MAKASLTLIQPARSPERQRLADAILERDRRAKLVEAKRAEITAEQERRYALWTQQSEAQERLRGVAGQWSEIERREALLRGETPPAQDTADVFRAELAKVEAELEQSKQAEAVLAGDAHLLESAHSMSAYEVQEAVGAVILSEAAPAAVVAEYNRLTEQVRMLDRAIQGALNVSFVGGGSSMASHHVVRGLPALPPCPWQAARDRLASDPDARLPMPEDIFAEPPPRSAA